VRALRCLSTCLLLVASTAVAGEYAIHGTTDKDVAIYKPGEPMTFTFRVLDGDAPVSGMTLKWTRSGDDGRKASGQGVAGAEGLKVRTSMRTPGFVRVQVQAFGPDGQRLQGYVGGWGANKQGKIFFDGGACVQPEKLRAITEPRDFDAFWAATRKKLDRVPINPRLRELTSKDTRVTLYATTLDCAGPKPVTGYLTVPANARPKSLGAVVQFHGYGVRKHNPPGWLNRWSIVFDVNAHGMELGREDEYYTGLQQELRGYCFDKTENLDREKTYYYGMALRVMRALEYVKTRPEWNGRDLQANGGSQGGLQSLWSAGLDHDVTSSSIWSPWCCDFGGITLGRMRGWRPDYTKALDYFDPVFHAKRSKNKVHLVANYGDYTCPPSSVWVVYNNIPHQNKSMEVKQGCTHGYKMKNHMKYAISPTGVKDVGVAKK